MFHREFLWPTSAKWVQTLICCIIVIRNGLNTKRSSHFWCKFHCFWFNSLGFPCWLVMTCVIPSQMPYSFIIFNVSCSINAIVAQWRHISSESAVVYVLPNQFKYCPWIAWDILLVILSVTGNLCNKCPKCLVKQNSSYSDYFNAISGLYQTAEPQEAPWHFGGQCGARGCQNC